MYLRQNCIRASSESAHQSAKCWNTYGGSVTLFHIPCRKSKRNDAFAISKTLVAPQQSTIGRLYHQPKKQFDKFEIPIDEKCLFPSDTVRSISLSCCFVLFAWGLHPARFIMRSTSHRVPGWETSHGAIAICAGVHAILRAQAHGYTVSNNNRRWNSESRMRPREMQFRNASRGVVAGTRAAGYVL